MKRYFAGIEGESGLVMSTDGFEIGVLRAFNIDRSRPVHPIDRLPEQAVYEIPERVVHTIPLERVVIHEAALRRLFPDAEWDDAPEREETPSSGGPSDPYRR